MGQYCVLDAWGTEDAHNGVSDKQFFEHQNKRIWQDFLVRENAYRSAWDKDCRILKRTAWADATNGLGCRPADARKRDVKFVEAEYQAMWGTALTPVD